MGGVPVVQGTDVSWACLPWPWQAGVSQRRGMAQRWPFALHIAYLCKKQARQCQSLAGKPTGAPRDPPLWRAPLPLSVFHEAGVAVHSMGSRMGMDRPCPPPNTRHHRRRHRRPGAFCAPCAAALCSSAATATAASATAAQGAHSRPEVAPSALPANATRTAARAVTPMPNARGDGEPVGR